LLDAGKQAKSPTVGVDGFLDEHGLHKGGNDLGVGGTANEQGEDFLGSGSEDRGQTVGA
jgi:hypothetical protein